jgi:hypothetical protein
MKQVMLMIETVSGLLGKDENQLLSSFPRDIERIITFALQVPVLKQRELTISTVTEFLCAIRGNPTAILASSDRKLHGLLYVGPPSSLIFINATLPAHVQAYIMAHELGHLLADVFLVQQLWLKSLPQREEAVRKHFIWEDVDVDPWLELRAFLKGLPPRPHTIVGRGTAFIPETTEREIIADLFAREFLAPWSKLESLYKANNKRAFSEIARSVFHLPLRVAANYYDDIDLSLGRRSDIFDRLHSRLNTKR